MPSEAREKLIAELAALQRRIVYCQYLARRKDTITPAQADEWAEALSRWNTLISVLEYDLGDIPARAH